MWNWELFTGIFGGIIVGGLVGGFSLFIIEIYNKFFRRKEVIRSLISEIHSNIQTNKLLIFKYKAISENYEELLNYSNVKYPSYSSKMLNNYIKDIHLLLSNDLISKVLRLYDYSDNHAYAMRDEIVKHCENSIKKIKNTKKEFDRIDSGYKESIKNMDAVKILEFKKIINELKDINKKIISESKKVIDNNIKLLRKGTKEYKEEALELSVDLEIELDRSFFAFIKLFYRYYFDVTKIYWDSKENTIKIT